MSEQSHIDNLQRALFECAIHAGMDLSDFRITPGVAKGVDDYDWRRLHRDIAVDAVRELRRDYDEACNEVWELSYP